MAHGVRALNHRHIHVAAFLQRRRGDSRGLRVLAVDRLFSGADVHFTEENTQVEHPVDLPPNAERRLLGRVGRGGRRFLRRCGSRS